MVKKKIIDTVEKLRLASQNIPKVWDGRESTLEMKDANFKYWKQTEWMDFYFKFLCQKYFTGTIDLPGKKYGITEFDAFCEISWDFKVDSIDPSTYSVTANEAEAIADTLSDYGYYGIILAIGDIEFDDKETTVKKCHDELRGKVNEYDTNKINSGIMSRTRKTAFVLEEIHFICFDSKALHKCCGMLQDFPEDTVSSKLKPEEIIIDIPKIPNASVVGTEIFYGKVRYDSKFQYGIDC